MQITSPCVVSLVWRLEDTQGALIDELSEPVEFFFGGDDLLGKVEDALVGQEVGFQTQLHLEPEHAFGDYDSRLVFFEELNCARTSCLAMEVPQCWPVSRLFAV